VSFLRSLYLRGRLFWSLGCISAAFVLAYLYPAISVLPMLMSVALGIALLSDLLLLYQVKAGVKVNRNAPQRLSNGDENQIYLNAECYYPYRVDVEIIDEIPHQFQIRDFSIKTRFDGNDRRTMSYSLRPVQRGEYEFGDILCFIQTPIALLRRKVRNACAETIPVYPSFIQMRKFELYAISNRLTDIGVKKIRRLGHTMEFDQIRTYVQGDDIRSINWKATARANEIMVNQYQDEKSQQVINVIDKGRVMKMPFDGLHLLDYAINTSLVLSNIALLKQDKAGLMVFNDRDINYVEPAQKRTHIQRIQEALYKVSTNFMESDFESLYINLRQKVRQRSLILLYTNFETFSSMKRQLPYLQRIAKDHLLVTIFFENTELTKLIEKESDSLPEIYTKTIAEKFAYEKREIVRYLNQRGIQTILTPPKELSVNAINKYLELKSRGLI
jgi:uncharacterized protein (DUF58 family)